MDDLTFTELRAANTSRRNRWHSDAAEQWTISDWAVAMMGEAGEACNAIKKLRRIQCRMRNENKPGRQLTDEATAIDFIGCELADTIVYMDLLAKELGIDLDAYVRKVFNTKSAELNFPERL